MFQRILDIVNNIDYKKLVYQIHAVSLVVFGAGEAPFLILLGILALCHIRIHAIVFIINAILIFLGVILPRLVYRDITPKTMEKLIEQAKGL